MVSTLGDHFRMTAFGESHGEGVGVVLDGVPPGFPLSVEQIQSDMEKRRPGQSIYTTLRKEEDNVQVLSGIYNGRTTGGPLTLFVKNTDVQSSTYADVDRRPRPSHLDYTAHVKYKGYFDYRGGGFLSGRMTATMVMGGAVAKQILSSLGVQVYAFIRAIGGKNIPREPSREEIAENTYKSPVRCPVPEFSQSLEQAVLEARRDGDSLGAIVECVAFGVPPGYGEPIFDSAESKIAHAIFSVPAVKGIEFGAGFAISGMRGSTANDEFYVAEGRVLTRTNKNGGILGGITNGMPLQFRVAFKPTSSISKPQRTIDLNTLKEEIITVKGRHDPCVAIRGVIVIEDITCAVLADLLYPAIHNAKF